MHDAGTKVCPKCKLCLPLIDYRNNKNNKDKKEARCKKCCKEYEKEYRKTDVCKSLYKKYRESHVEELKEYDRKRSISRKEKRNKQLRERRKEDPNFRLRINIGSDISRALKRNGGSKRGYSITNKLSYTLSELKKHLENQFDNKMSWDNYGSYWVIDHIIPQVFFYYTSMDDRAFTDCWDLSNLRPAEKTENMKKGSKYNGVYYKKYNRPK